MMVMMIINVKMMSRTSAYLRSHLHWIFAILFVQGRQNRVGVMHNFRLVSKTLLSCELVVDSDQCKHKSIGDQLTIGMISAIVSRTSPAPRAFGIPNEEKNESRDFSREFLQKPCDLYKTTHNDLHYLQMTSVCSTARCKIMIFSRSRRCFCCAKI